MGIWQEREFLDGSFGAYSPSKNLMDYAHGA